MTESRRALLVILAVAFAAVASSAEAQDECAGCHDAVVAGFKSTAHGRYFAAGKDHRDATCISCHTGAKEHAASGGATKPLDLRRAAPDRTNAPCLSCHTGTPKTAMWEGSAHQRANLRCENCHHGAPHAHRKRRRGAPRPARSRRKSTRRCLECHGTAAPGSKRTVAPSASERPDGLRVVPQPARHNGREARREGLGERALLLVPPEPTGARSSGSIRRSVKTA